MLLDRHSPVTEKPALLASSVDVSSTAGPRISGFSIGLWYGWHGVRTPPSRSRRLPRSCRLYGHCGQRVRPRRRSHDQRNKYANLGLSRRGEYPFRRAVLGDRWRRDATLGTERSRLIPEKKSRRSRSSLGCSASLKVPIMLIDLDETDRVPSSGDRTRTTR